MGIETNMANEKTVTKSAEKNPAAAVAGPNYMPEGYSDDDFAVVGGFTPMYKPENAWSKESNKAKPGIVEVFGWGVCVDALPVIKDPKGKEADRIPLVASILLVAPNRGVRGKKGEEVPVECAVGERILVPIGGNLLWNKPFMEKLFDSKRYWLMKLKVIGTQASDYPSDTWMWEVSIAKTPKLRAEHPEIAAVETALHPAIIQALDEKVRKALPMTAYMPNIPMLGVGVTSSGEVYDKDGVLVSRVVTNGQSASA